MSVRTRAVGVWWGLAALWWAIQAVGPAWAGEAGGGRPVWRLTVEAAGSALAPRPAWIAVLPEEGAWPEGVRYRWRCGEEWPEVETARAGRGCWYERPGRYRPSVTILVPGEAPVTLRAAEAIAVAARPAPSVALDVRPSHPRWRAPLAVTASVQARGFPEDEPVTQIAWVLDDRPAGEGRATRMSFDDPGEHRLVAVLKTPWRTVTASRVLAVRANAPPACWILQEAAEPPAPPLTVRLTARCRDADGEVVRYRWRADAAEGAGASWEWTAPKAGTYTVRLQAADDAGAETEATALVRWDPS